MNISSYIPASFRKPLYGAFAVIGVLIGAFQVGISAINGVEPEWLTVAVNVFPFLAGAIGFTAAANTSKNVDGEGWDNRIDGSMADYATEDDVVEIEED